MKADLFHVNADTARSRTKNVGRECTPEANNKICEGTKESTDHSNEFAETSIPDCVRHK